MHMVLHFKYFRLMFKLMFFPPPQLFRNYTVKPYVVTVNDDDFDIEDIENKSEYMLNELGM